MPQNTAAKGNSDSEFSARWESVAQNTTAMEAQLFSIQQQGGKPTLNTERAQCLRIQRSEGHRVSEYNVRGDSVPQNTTVRGA